MLSWQSGREQHCTGDSRCAHSVGSPHALTTPNPSSPRRGIEFKYGLQCMWLLLGCKRTRDLSALNYAYHEEAVLLDLGQTLQLQSFHDRASCYWLKLLIRFTNRACIWEVGTQKQTSCYLNKETAWTGKVGPSCNSLIGFLKILYLYMMNLLKLAFKPFLWISKPAFCLQKLQVPTI